MNTEAKKHLKEYYLSESTLNERREFWIWCARYWPDDFRIVVDKMHKMRARKEKGQAIDKSCQFAIIEL